MFHLGWFVGNGFGLNSWGPNWAGSFDRSWTKPDNYIEMARSLERASFDYMIFEDGLMIPNAYEGSMRAYLKHALEGPRNDPTALVAVLSQYTSRIGLIPTLSTSFYPPFMAARMLATLDHLTGGRAGGNLVTSSSHRAAQNFGLDEHIEHDLRYEMAGEWVELVEALLASWEPGAVVFDEASNTYADHTKVHEIDFEGRFHRSRGPLNTPPGPQGRPVICQAGGSPAGRDFAARHADTIIAVPLGIDGMKQYRDDISSRMERFGRDPSDCKVMFMVNPVIAETDADAEAEYDRRWAMRDSEAYLEASLATMSYFSGLDFSEFDLDQPMPDLTGRVNGHQSSMTRYAKDGEDGRTLRELVINHDTVESLRLVGSPSTVATQMAEAMDAVGGDGFLFTSADFDRRHISAVTDGLVPVLKKRGQVRSAYAHEHFRDNLLDF
jgi:FMN-dependent oxidoreductase (nitrilotriacetate monooxygenase family)